MCVYLCLHVGNPENNLISSTTIQCLCGLHWSSLFYLSLNYYYYYYYCCSVEAWRSVCLINLCLLVIVAKQTDPVSPPVNWNSQQHEMACNQASDSLASSFNAPIVLRLTCRTLQHSIVYTSSRVRFCMKVSYWLRSPLRGNTE